MGKIYMRELSDAELLTRDLKNKACFDLWALGYPLSFLAEWKNVTKERMLEIIDKQRKLRKDGERFASHAIGRRFKTASRYGPDRQRPRC